MKLAPDPLFQRFFDAKFPGMLTTDGDLTTIVKLMASESPTSFIRATVALNGYDTCSNFRNLSGQGSTPTLSIRKRSVTDFQECNSGYISDGPGSYCYRLFPGKWDVASSSDLCSFDYAEVLTFNNDQDVQLFISLATQGTSSTTIVVFCKARNLSVF